MNTVSLYPQFIDVRVKSLIIQKCPLSALENMPFILATNVLLDQYKANLWSAFILYPNIMLQAVKYHCKYPHPPPPSPDAHFVARHYFLQGLSW